MGCCSDNQKEIVFDEDTRKRTIFTGIKQHESDEESSSSDDDSLYKEQE